MSGFHTALGRVYAMLDLAAAKAGNRAAMCSVDVNLQELITIDTHGPRGVELRDDLVVTALDFERAVGGIVCSGLVRLSGFVNALVHVRGPHALHGRDDRRKCDRARTASARTCRKSFPPPSSER